VPLLDEESLPWGERIETIPRTVDGLDAIDLCCASFKRPALDSEPVKCKKPPDLCQAASCSWSRRDVESALYGKAVNCDEASN